MRRSNTQKIGDILREYINEAQIGHKLKEVDVVKAWEEVMGKVINNYTSKIYYSKNKLYVHLKSPVVKSELIMMREQIRQKINEKAGTDMVHEIVFR